MCWVFVVFIQNAANRKINRSTKKKKTKKPSYITYDSNIYDTPKNIIPLLY